MKKVVCTLLAVLQVLLCFAACGEANNGGNSTTTDPAKDTVVYAYPSEVPTYADDKEFEMVAFWSPPNTEEFYQGVVDCGFTSIIIDSKYGVTPESNQMLETLQICDDLGLDAYIALGRGHSLSASYDFSKFKSFRGYNTDEPLTKDQLDTIAGNIETLGNVYPSQGKTYLTTLVHSTIPEIEKDFGTFQNYVDYYFQHGGSAQNAFMYDIYPLQGTTLKGEINGRWLASLEELAAASQKYDVDLYPYLATMSIRSQTCRRPAEDDMRYVSYVNLAYGVKGFAYFCYMSPGGPPYDGEFVEADWALVYYTDINDHSTYYKTPPWDIVKAVNEEMKTLDHVILSFDWQGTMKSAGSEASTTAGKNCFREAKIWLKSHGGIKSFTSTEDAILGTFKDANGYDGFMLVNFSDPLYDKENTVTLELRGATRAVVYIKGEPQTVELDNGTYTVTLQPGEGQFIIPLA